MEPQQTAPDSLHPPVSIDGVPQPSGGESQGFFAPMNEYQKKLNDTRWYEFRRLVFRKHGEYCRTCGPEDCNHPLQVHHKKYIRGAEPWEYDMDDVQVLCSRCHEEIHECETRWRNLIRSLPSWSMLELTSLVEELEQLEEGDVQQIAAYAKNAARSAKWRTKAQ